MQENNIKIWFKYFSHPVYWSMFFKISKINMSNILNDNMDKNGQKLQKLRRFWSWSDMYFDTLVLPLPDTPQTDMLNPKNWIKIQHLGLHDFNLWHSWQCSIIDLYFDSFAKKKSSDLLIKSEDEMMRCTFE